MFDRYLVAQSERSWKRRALIIGSLAVHGLAAAVLIIWSFFHVEEIVPPALSLTVLSAPPPPPPPPPLARHKSASVESKPHPVEKMVQPTEVPKIVQPKEAEKPKEEETQTEDGVEGGQADGVKNGTVGGASGGTVGGAPGGTVGGTGTDLSAKPRAPKLLPQFLADKERLSSPDPHLPEWFTGQHAGQIVKGMYRICVRTDGRIADVFVMTSIPGMDQAIIDQVKSTWTYKPQHFPFCSPRIFQFQIR